MATITNQLLKNGFQTGYKRRFVPKNNMPWLSYPVGGHQAFYGPHYPGPTEVKRSAKIPSRSVLSGRKRTAKTGTGLTEPQPEH